MLFREILSAVELSKSKGIPFLLSLLQIKVVEGEGDGAKEHVLLELVVVPDGGLQGPALDHVLGNPVFQHLHEAGITVLADDLGLSFGYLCRVRMKIHFNVGIRLLL